MLNDISFEVMRNRIITAIVRIHLRRTRFRVIAWIVSAAFGVISVGLFFLVSPRLVTSPVGWERGFVVSPPSLQVREFAHSARGSVIALVFDADKGPERGVYSIVSLDGGVTYTEPAALAVGPIVNDDSLLSPSIALSGNGLLFCAWQEYDSATSSFSIAVSRSDDLGGTWSAKEKIELPDISFSFKPLALFDDNGGIHIIFHAIAEDSFMLYHIAKDSDGVWSDPVEVARISSAMKGAFFPSVVWRGDYVYVAWQAKGLEQSKLSDDIYFCRSTNKGRSFSSPQKITLSASDDSAPYLYANGDTLFCVYQNNEKKNWEICYVWSNTLGETWSLEPVTVSSTNANCYAPAMTATGSGSLSFIWYDNREGPNKIFSREYNPVENRFTREVAISDGRDSVLQPVCYEMGARILALYRQSGRVRGKLSDNHVEPPRVFSRSNPVDVWTKNRTAVIEWTTPADESGVAGFASLLTDNPETIPTVQNLSEKTRKETIFSVRDGVTYYHLRTIDGAGNYSRTIHYPLRVSSTPLPMPLIESKTHPEGVSVQSDSPEFTIQISDIERVKGFLYSLTRDFPSRGNTFTDKLNLSWSGLPEGRYFLHVQGVDKTNTTGRAADYEFIVGKAEKIDPNQIKKIIEGGQDLSPVPVVRVVFPFVKIVSPKKDEILSRKSISAEVKDFSFVGYQRKWFEYELRADGKSIMKGVTGSSTIHLNDLNEGKYVLSIRGVYSKKLGEYKTKPESVSFSVFIPPVIDPIQKIVSLFESKAAMHALIIIIALSAFSLLLVFALSGRFIFFIQAIIWRIYTRVRVIIDLIQIAREEGDS